MKKMKCLWIFLLLVALLFAKSNNAFAVSGEVQAKTGEVVFLLDASGSMNTQDKERGAIDAICQAVCCIPTGYQAGVVVYNTGIQASIPFGADPNQIKTQLSSITYNGYTNAGEGINQAVSLFSDGDKGNRSIIILTDGEIDMPGKQEKEQSRALYNDTVERAKDRDIKIYIIAIGDKLGDPKMNIFNGAEATGGGIYWESRSGSLSQIMQRIIRECLGIPYETLGVTDANGGTIYAELPSGASRAKILITSGGGLTGITADYRAESGHTFTGRCYAVVDMKRPASGFAELRFKASEVSDLQASLLIEYDISPALTIDYRFEQLPRTEEEIKKKAPPEYHHFADISIAFLDAGGSHENVFKGEDYEGRQIPFQLNGISYTGGLHQGILSQSIPADGIAAVEAAVDLSSLDGVFYINQPVTAPIKRTPDPVFETEADYWPLWLLLAALTAAIAGIIIWWARKKNTAIIYVTQPPASGGPAKKMETKACAYSGKLNLYVVKTADERDIPPQVCRLFGRAAGPMTLDRVLASCGIKFGKIGAGDITLYPGPDHSVIIVDQSERCTVLRGTEILKKGMGHPVYYNEKLTIAFEDEATEMEIHYKNLKPSEREG